MDKGKKEIRSLIRERKKLYSNEVLAELSDQLFEKLEKYEKFLNADNILLYYSLPDEVFTHKFIEKWFGKKKIILPVVIGNDLELREYSGKDCLKKGCFNIEEPQGKLWENTGTIDLAIIPGMSFDYNGNRLGRGKGFYDRLLSELSVYKIGICFGFQIWNEGIPAEEFDMIMDEVWTEKGRVLK